MIRERVIKARKIQEERYKGIPHVHCNAQMTPKLVREFCQLDAQGDKMLSYAMDKMGLSARAYDRILKVSRTIADLESAPNIEARHLAEAINYRNLDRETWGQ